MQAYNFVLRFDFADTSTARNSGRVETIPGGGENTATPRCEVRSLLEEYTEGYSDDDEQGHDDELVFFMQQGISLAEPRYGAIVLPDMPPGNGDLLKLYLQQSAPELLMRTFVEVDTFFLANDQTADDQSRQVRLYRELSWTNALMKAWSDGPETSLAYKAFLLVDNSAGLLARPTLLGFHHAEETVHERVILVDSLIQEPTQRHIVALRAGDLLKDAWWAIHRDQPMEMHDVVGIFKQGDQIFRLRWWDSMQDVRPGAHGRIVLHRECSEVPQRSKPPRILGQDRRGYNDDHALMQALAFPRMPVHHVVQYVYSSRSGFISQHRDRTILVRAYLHLWRDRGVPRRAYRFIRLRPDSDPHLRVAETWTEHEFLYRRRPFIVPVKPMPYLTQEPTPVWLITDHDSEHFVLSLVDYTSEERVFTASALINGQQGFPLAVAIFQQLIPENTCTTRTYCFIRANGRHYTQRQAVPLYGGIFLQLYEEPEESDPSSSCDSTMDPTDSDSSSTIETTSEQESIEEPPNDVDMDEMVLFQQYPLPTQIFAMTDDGQVTVEGEQVTPWDAWDQFAAQMARVTIISGIEQALQEARAFWQARGEHPKFVVVVANEHWLDGFQESFGRLPGYAYPDFAGVIRANLAPWFSFAITLHVWQVEPNLTPYEQDQEDDIYMVVDQRLPQGIRVAILIVHDPEDLGVIDRKAVRVPAFLTDQLTYQAAGCETKCRDSEYVCVVEHQGQRYMPGLYWEVSNGMKLVVSIMHKNSLERCPVGHLNLLQQSVTLVIAPFLDVQARVTDQHGFVVQYDLQEEEDRLLRLHNLAAMLQVHIRASQYIRKLIFFRHLRHGHNNRLEYSAQNALDILLDMQVEWPDLWDVRFALEKLRTPRSMQIMHDTMVFLLRTDVELHDALNHPFLLEVVTNVGQGAGSMLAIEETAEEQSGAKIAEAFYPGWCRLQDQCGIWLNGARMEWQALWTLREKTFVQIIAHLEHFVSRVSSYRVLAQHKGGRLMAVPTCLPDHSQVIVFHQTMELGTEVFEFRVRWYMYPRWIQTAATAHWNDLQVDQFWSMITVHESRKGSRAVGDYFQVLLTRPGAISGQSAIVLVELATSISLGTADCHAQIVTYEATACHILQGVLHDVDCSVYSAHHNGIPIAVDARIRFHDGDYLAFHSPGEREEAVCEPSQKRSRINSPSSDLTSLFQVVPPLNSGMEEQSPQQRRDWVRNTILARAPELMHRMNAYKSMNGDWPLYLMHYVGHAHLKSTFGFQPNEWVSPDVFRVAVRQASRHVFAHTQEITVGLVCPQPTGPLENRHDTLDVLVHNQRVQVHEKPVLIKLYRYIGKRVEARSFPALFYISVTQEQIWQHAFVFDECVQGRMRCNAYLEGRVKITSAPVRLQGWQLIDLVLIHQRPEPTPTCTEGLGDDQILMLAYIHAMAPPQ